MSNSWFKKEKPLLGLLGTGGGAVGPGVVSPGEVATGGTKSTPGDGYIYHLFTSSGPFYCWKSGGLAAPENEILAVAGGGSGASRHGGGGGGGGVINTGPASPNGRPAFSKIAIPEADHTVTIGAGGNKSVPNISGGGPGPVQGLNGHDTTLGTLLRAAGGGCGGNYDEDPGRPGGSGGGAGNGPEGGTGGPGGGSANQYGPSSPVFPSPAPGQGYSGGGSAPGGAGFAGAGGGGAAGSGQPAPSNNHGGNGGEGAYITWVFPTMGGPGTENQPGNTGGRYFAGGGGGGDGGNSGGDVGLGGFGGAGSGGPHGGNEDGFNGTVNSGSGGGGARNQPGGNPDQEGGAGGSGVLIIRYPASTPA